VETVLPLWFSYLSASVAALLVVAVTAVVVALRESGDD
jgi:hypothetical protein